MIGMIMTQSTLLHTGLDEFWIILTISRLSPYAFTWDTWNWTNSNTANPRNSCVTNGTERICVFVRYCANIVLNIIKCSQPRSQALPSCGEKTQLVTWPIENEWPKRVRKNLILHVSTSALHTSIARSDRSVQSSLRIIITSKYLLNLVSVCF
jgi:hypothetical protein